MVEQKGAGGVREEGRGRVDAQMEKEAKDEPKKLTSSMHQDPYMYAPAAPSYPRAVDADNRARKRGELQSCVAHRPAMRVGCRRAKEEVEGLEMEKMKGCMRQRCEDGRDSAVCAGRDPRRTEDVGSVGKSFYVENLRARRSRSVNADGRPILAVERAPNGFDLLAARDALAEHHGCGVGVGGEGSKYPWVPLLGYETRRSDGVAYDEWTSSELDES
ncbi:hypothetical protein C8F04DRAFT_1199903 [Mycena alexandri]|uniref:Uncharacterized protein n=1 Tax=Mycena alexandri TaxID=1745969 RepID=A0AAD6WR24_9AGAR|nr:hypothetical protein C8F04DRAFT_1199903 [Mycena alexandri]